MEITQLWRYPVKSCRGTSVDALDIEPWGPVGDRRWAVIDPDGHKVTARTAPNLLSLTAHPRDDGGVLLENHDGETLAVAPPVDGTRVAVDFSRLPHAADAGDVASQFLSDAIGRPLRLVWQPDPRERSVNVGNGGRPGEVLSLADAGPLLLTSEVSLQQLQTWVGDAPQLSMQRFRPNIVVDGELPFAEDVWTHLRLGGTMFRVQELCDRCVMTTIDPDTLEQGPEPLRTMERHRGWDRKTFFGIRLVPQTDGRVCVGDAADPAEI